MAVEDPERSLAGRITRGRRYRRGRFDRRGLVEGLWASRTITAPEALLAAAMAFVAAFYTVHLALLHDRFWTTGYDLGIFDQAAWLVANGKTFITIRGLSFWGHHINPGMLLFAPFYWLGAGPRFLNTVMVVAFVLGARPVYRIAIFHLRHEWLALALAVAYLLQTGAQWTLRETFHPELMAVTPMLYAYLAMLEGRWRAYVLWLVLAVSWKEDIAITVTALGLVVLLKGHRRAGIATVVCAIAYYYFCTKVVLPHFTPAGPFYSEFLGPLGDSPVELAKNAVLHPTLFTDQFQRAGWYKYPRDLAQPFAFTSFLSWPGLVIALPQMTLNLLTRHSYAWSIQWHYVAMPTVGFTIASIEGVANLKRWAARLHNADVARRLPSALAAIIASCAIVMSAMWAPSYGRRYDDPGVWPRTETEHLQVLRRAVNMVPDGVTVAVSYNFSTHLAHREFIYEFPNPWRNSYWGVDQRLENGTVQAWPPARDPASVEWLAVDKGTLGPASLELLDEVLTTEAWVEVFDQGNVVVAHRAS